MIAVHVPARTPARNEWSTAAAVAAGTTNSSGGPNSSQTAANPSRSAWIDASSPTVNVHAAPTPRSGASRLPPTRPPATRRGGVNASQKQPASTTASSAILPGGKPSAASGCRRTKATTAAIEVATAPVTMAAATGAAGQSAKPGSAAVDGQEEHRSSAAEGEPPAGRPPVHLGQLAEHRLSPGLLGLGQRGHHRRQQPARCVRRRSPGTSALPPAIDEQPGRQQPQRGRDGEPERQPQIGVDPLGRIAERGSPRVEGREDHDNRHGRGEFVTAARSAHVASHPASDRRNAAVGCDETYASSEARTLPGPVSRYRCRGGRPAGASVSHVVSSSPRSASRTRIGYSDPGLRSSWRHSS